jgi:hypothetical protein
MVYAKRLFWLLIPACLFSLGLRTESDIYSAYREGYYDYETCVALCRLMQDKLDLCGPLEELRIVPEITEEDIGLLEDLCRKGTVRRSAIPPDLLARIEAFVILEEEAPQRVVRADYRFFRNLDDTLYSLEKEHYFSTAVSAPHWRIRSQGRADAFGNGYFLRNYFELSNLHKIKKWRVGSFRAKAGRGLTLGGAASPRTGQDRPDSFQESLLSPGTSEPFGMWLALSVSRAEPFAFYFSNDDKTAHRGKNTIQGAGSKFRFSGLTMGFLGLHSRTRTLNHQGLLTATCLGLYGSLLKGTSSLKSEVSFSDSGFAFDLTGIRKGGRVDAGLGLRHYSGRYINPAGRGVSAFYAKVTQIRADGDSLALSGLRSAEKNMDAFLRFHRKNLSIRPAVLFARSDRWEEDYVRFSLREEAGWEKTGTRLILTQDFYLKRRAADTRTGYHLNGRCHAAVSRKHNLEGRVRFTHANEGRNVFSTRLNHTLFFSRLLTFKTGYLWTLAREGASEDRTSGLYFEEVINTGGKGLIRFFGMLAYDHPAAAFQPGHLGLFLSLSI